MCESEGRAQERGTLSVGGLWRQGVGPHMFAPPPNVVWWRCNFRCGFGKG